MKMRNAHLVAALAVRCQPAVPGDILTKKRYLHILVAREGEMQMVHLSVEGRVIQYFRIPLPEDNHDALYWASARNRKAALTGTATPKLLQVRELRPMGPIFAGRKVGFE